MNTEWFRPASREPIPPLVGEPREVIDLEDELIEDPTIASLAGDTYARSRCLSDESWPQS